MTSKSRKSTPDYEPRKFVDRNEEVKLVQDSLPGVEQRIRTIVFTGERGTGKSWLLKHLQRELPRLGEMRVFMLDLLDYAKWKGPSLAVIDMLHHIASSIRKGTSPAGANLPEVSRALFQLLHPTMAQQAVVLLVDHVYETDWKLLEVLEDYLLGPLAIEPRALIVMAGRGRAHPWKTIALRRSRTVSLQPFPEQITREQLKRQHKEALPRARQIYTLSSGNPLANYLLAVHPDPAQSLRQAIDEMLETIPKETRPHIRKYLEALCVLRSFREDHIPTMLAAYYQNEGYREWSHAQARQVHDELMKSAFARWDTDRDACVIDEPTRNLLEQYLFFSSRETWRRLHEAALQLFEEWAKTYHDTSTLWSAEADYHTYKLASKSVSR